MKDEPEDLSHELLPAFEKISNIIEGMACKDAGILLAAVLTSIVCQMDQPHRKLTELFMYTKKVVDKFEKHMEEQVDK